MMKKSKLEISFTHVCNSGTLRDFDYIFEALQNSYNKDEYVNKVLEFILLLCM